MKGFTGKILHVDLNELKTHIISTENYRKWGGGHGMGAALFWDLCENIEQVKDGRDPRNVVSIMASPFSGTFVPSAGGRCEVTGVGVGAIPRNLFTRSNFGGHFSAMMKHAGWDGVVVTGKAPVPIYIDIKNDHVAIREADHLWGKDTYETQQILQTDDAVNIEATAGWNAVKEDLDIGRTTQKPAVLTIGPAGENQVAFSCLLHGAGNAAGQGGFGAVFGSKNLKAIRVLGTKSVAIADPAALLRARFTTREDFAHTVDDPQPFSFPGLGNKPNAVSFPLLNDQHRVSACHGCINGCKQRNAIGYGNESTCQTTAWYMPAVAAKLHRDDADIKLTPRDSRITEDSMYAAEVTQRLGVNSYPIAHLLPWIQKLAAKGLIGPGKQIESNLPFDDFGSRDFADKFCDAIATGTDIGAYFVDGAVPGIIKMGREQDHLDGTVKFPYHGMPEHGYDPRCELEWGYATIVTDRDMNDHGLNWIYWTVNLAKLFGKDFPLPAETLVSRFVEKMQPYVKPEELSAMDYSTDNMYSEVLARQVQWVNHYGRFWKNSALLCDFRWPDCLNTNRADLKGATGDDQVGEQVWWNAVTGENITYVDGIQRGRMIFNLDNAIWALQGRHRDDAKFTDYIYDKKITYSKLQTFLWPATDENGQWDYREMLGRQHSREGVEKWKDHYYRAEGWDIETGWPTRAILEELGLEHVADRLEHAGKLGSEA